jgi:hypothetical protein
MEATEATTMRLRYDPTVDAAFASTGDDIRPGQIAANEKPDEDRRIVYDVDDRILGYEFLNVRRWGVRLDDLPHGEELARLFAAHGFRVRGEPGRIPAG